MDRVPRWVDRRAATLGEEGGGCDTGRVANAGGETCADRKGGTLPRWALHRRYVPRLVTVSAAQTIRSCLCRSLLAHQDHTTASGDRRCTTSRTSFLATSSLMGCAVSTASFGYSLATRTSRSGRSSRATGRQFGSTTSVEEFCRLRRGSARTAPCGDRLQGRASQSGSHQGGNPQQQQRRRRPPRQRRQGLARDVAKGDARRSFEEREGDYAVEPSSQRRTS